MFSASINPAEPQLVVGDAGNKLQCSSGDIVGRNAVVFVVKR
jgi:hypothetical protein